MDSGFHFDEEAAAHEAIEAWLEDRRVVRSAGDARALLHLAVTRALLARPRSEQATLAIVCLERARHHAVRLAERTGVERDRERRWRLERLGAALLRRALPFGDGALGFLIERCARPSPDEVPTAAQVLRQVAHARSERAFPPEVVRALRRLRTRLVPATTTARARRRLRELEGLLGLGRHEPAGLPDPGEEWADLVRAELAALHTTRPAAAAAWEALLAHAATARGTEPTGRWLTGAGRALVGVGAEAFTAALARWVPAVARASEPLADRGAEQLRGLAWCCRLLDDPALDALLGELGAAAYTKLPRFGPRSAKLGNACVRVLAARPGDAPVAELARLRARLSYARARRLAGQALAEAAALRRLSPADVEELATPTFGLGPDGARRASLGAIQAELVVVGPRRAELRFAAPGGELQPEAPERALRHHAPEVAALREAARSLPPALVAQARRLEGSYLTPRSWPFATWRERLLDHPLLQHLARRLIWIVGRGARTRAVIWDEGRLVELDGAPAGAAPDEEVRLWHPLDAAPSAVREWRRWLLERGVTQPFAQAWRELYRPGEPAAPAGGPRSARRATRAGSRARDPRGGLPSVPLQRSALRARCRRRGWSYVRSRKGDAARRALPGTGLSVELRLRGAPAGAAGEAADRVAPCALAFYDAEGARVALEAVPALVFSELLRELTLLTEGAALGGAAGCPALERLARCRGEVLRAFLPRVPLGERCAVGDHALVVRGTLGRYAVALAGREVLTVPGGRPLRLEPGWAAARRVETLPLPFCGDEALQRVLGLALFLAEDHAIEDERVLGALRAA